MQPARIAAIAEPNAAAANPFPMPSVKDPSPGLRQSTPSKEYHRLSCDCVARIRRRRLTQPEQARGALCSRYQRGADARRRRRQRIVAALFTVTATASPLAMTIFGAGSVGSWFVLARPTERSAGQIQSAEPQLLSVTLDTAAVRSLPDASHERRNA
jgi:hypothetical protein